TETTTAGHETETTTAARETETTTAGREPETTTAAREIETTTVDDAIGTTSPTAATKKTVAVAGKMPRDAQTPISPQLMTASIPACGARWKAMAVVIDVIGSAKRRMAKLQFRAASAPTAIPLEARAAIALAAIRTTAIALVELRAEVEIPEERTSAETIAV